jgi:hypothetical protein
MAMWRDEPHFAPGFEEGAIRSVVGIGAGGGHQRNPGNAGDVDAIVFWDLPPASLSPERAPTAKTIGVPESIRVPESIGIVESVRVIEPVGISEAVWISEAVGVAEAPGVPKSVGVVEHHRAVTHAHSPSRAVVPTVLEPAERIESGCIEAGIPAARSGFTLRFGGPFRVVKIVASFLFGHGFDPSAVHQMFEVHCVRHESLIAAEIELIRLQALQRATG